MRKLTVFLLIFFTVGLSIYTAQLVHMVLPTVVNNYVNDFIILPIVLSLGLIAIRKLRNDDTITIPLSLIVALATGYAIYFEYFLPTFYPRYTADIIDVLLYYVSGILFFFVQKKF